MRRVLNLLRSIKSWILDFAYTDQDNVFEKHYPARNSFIPIQKVRQQLKELFKEFESQENIPDHLIAEKISTLLQNEEISLEDVVLLEKIRRLQKLYTKWNLPPQENLILIHFFHELNSRCIKFAVDGGLLDSLKNILTFELNFKHNENKVEEGFFEAHSMDSMDSKTQKKYDKNKLIIGRVEKVLVSIKDLEKNVGELLNPAQAVAQHNKDMQIFELETMQSIKVKIKLLKEALLANLLSKEDRENIEKNIQVEKSKHESSVVSETLIQEIKSIDEILKANLARKSEAGRLLGLVRNITDQLSLLPSLDQGTRQQKLEEKKQKLEEQKKIRATLLPDREEKRLYEEKENKQKLINKRKIEIGTHRELLSLMMGELEPTANIRFASDLLAQDEMSIIYHLFLDCSKSYFSTFLALFHSIRIETKNADVLIYVNKITAVIDQWQTQGLVNGKELIEINDTLSQKMKQAKRDAELAQDTDFMGSMHCLQKFIDMTLNHIEQLKEEIEDIKKKRDSAEILNQGEKYQVAIVSGGLVRENGSLNPYLISTLKSYDEVILMVPRIDFHVENMKTIFLENRDSYPLFVTIGQSIQALHRAGIKNVKITNSGEDSGKPLEYYDNGLFSLEQSIYEKGLRESSEKETNTACDEHEEREDKVKQYQNLFSGPLRHECPHDPVFSLFSDDAAYLEVISSKLTPIKIPFTFLITKKFPFIAVAPIFIEEVNRDKIKHLRLFNYATLVEYFITLLQQSNNQKDHQVIESIIKTLVALSDHDDLKNLKNTLQFLMNSLASLQTNMMVDHGSIKVNELRQAIASYLCELGGCHGGYDYRVALDKMTKDTRAKNFLSAVILELLMTDHLYINMSVLKQATLDVYYLSVSFTERGSKILDTIYALLMSHTTSLQNVLPELKTIFLAFNDIVKEARAVGITREGVRQLKDSMAEKFVYDRKDMNIIAYYVFNTAIKLLMIDNEKSATKKVEFIKALTGKHIEQIEKTQLDELKSDIKNLAVKKLDKLEGKVKKYESQCALLKESCDSSNLSNRLYLQTLLNIDQLKLNQSKQKMKSFNVTYHTLIEQLPLYNEMQGYLTRPLLEKIQEVLARNHVMRDGLTDEEDIALQIDKYIADFDRHSLPSLMETIARTMPCKDINNLFLKIFPEERDYFEKVCFFLRKTVQDINGFGAFLDWQRCLYAKKDEAKKDVGSNPLFFNTIVNVDLEVLSLIRTMIHTLSTFQNISQAQLAILKEHCDLVENSIKKEGRGSYEKDLSQVAAMVENLYQPTPITVYSYLTSSASAVGGLFGRAYQSMPNLPSVSTLYALSSSLPAPSLPSMPSLNPFKKQNG